MNDNYIDYTFEPQRSVLENITGGAIAAVADFGVSVYNSLPGTELADTADVLSRISNNAMNTYLENQDTIEAISFIGGSFVPGGVALKGMSSLRAGAKGVSWFSDLGKVTNMKRVEESLKMGSQATKEYRAARNAIYRNGIANQVVDAAAAEALIISTMNAHPFMEDYWDNPVQNFALGVGIGGIIGGGAGLIADRFQLNKVAAAVTGNAFKEVTQGLESSSVKAMPDVGRLQVLESNINTLKNLTSEEYKADPIVKEIASNFLLQEQSKQRDLFLNLLDPELRNAPKELQDVIQSFVANDTRFMNADGLKFFTVKEGEMVKTPIFTKGFSSKMEPEEVFDPATREPKALTDVVYHKEWDRFTSPEEASLVTRANALGWDEKALVTRLDKNFGYKPNTDAFLEVVAPTAATAPIDAAYLKALKQVDALESSKAIKDTIRAIAPDDVYTLNALVAKYKKNPELFEGVEFTVTNNKPSYDIQESNVLRANKVDKNHLANIKSLVVPEVETYNVYRSPSLDITAKKALKEWVGGNNRAKARLRAGMDKALRGGEMDESAIIARSIYDAPESKALRAKLREQADAEGYIYLYRGIHGKSVGHSPIESYTPSFSVAKGFGTPQLFRINVDDVIGHVYDGLREYEILVGSPARPAVALDSLSLKDKINTSFVQPKNVEKWDINKVEEMLYANKESAINTLLEQGASFETIAIKTNTPLDTVRAYAVNLSEGEGFNDLLTIGDYRFNTYTDAAKIPEYLSPETRPLRVQSNVNKAGLAKLKASLDQKLGLNANLEYMDVVAGNSASNTMRIFHKTFFGDEYNPQGMKPLLAILRDKVSEFNNSQLGNVFTQSADFFLRNTNTGPIVSLIGKNIQTVATKATQALTSPINEAMSRVVKNELALIEANTALALNASIKGRRIYQDRQFFIEKIENGKQTLEPVMWNGKPFLVKSNEVDNLLNTLSSSGRELYELKNTLNNIQGKAPLNDLGFWVPAFNPKGKQIAYVWDTEKRTTKLLWGTTDDELAEAISAYKSTIPAGKEKIIQVVTKAEQDLWNNLNNRLDPLTMEIANVEKLHTGSSAPAIVKNNADIFGEILGGYDNYIESYVKNTAELMMHDITDVLDNMSAFNRRFYDKQNGLSTVQKALNNPEDGARAVKNILLGNNNLNASPFWKARNENFETYTNWGINLVTKTIQEVAKPLGLVLGKGKEADLEAFKKLDYERVAKELEQAGITNPWQVFDEEAANVFQTASLTEAKNTSRRAIYASNAFAATFALRVLDLAQPLVNALSLPILTSLAKAQNHPATFMSSKLQTANVSTAQIMHEGARLANSPIGERLGKQWEEAGYFKSFISEANAVMRQSRQFEPDTIAKIENGLDSAFVNMLSVPADWTETFLRRQTMYTGAALAKRLYPDLNDTGITIFARDFMDRAMGNYHAPQRPVFFQGTMGTALGLFQTYMLTMGQSVYRHLELKNYKALGKAALLQSSIFGTNSMPGFELVSTAIGDNFSDDNIDLVTGTFRALDDTTATALIYGIPSSLGPAVYSRGDLQPRAVNPLGDGLGFAAANMVGQTIDFAGNLVKAASADNPDIGRSLAQAMSLQSVSRPLARASELLSGYSITRSGNTVATPSEVWSFAGITARLLSTRPIEEAKMRDIEHMDTVYGQLDYEYRKKATYELKLAIRNNTLDDEKLAKIADEYMKHSGTPRGWQSAVNRAIAETNTNGVTQMMNRLKPDNPLMYMIDEMDSEY